jgi:hypothetical protein
MVRVYSINLMCIAPHDRAFDLRSLQLSGTEPLSPRRPAAVGFFRIPRSAWVLGSLIISNILLNGQN